MVLGESTSPILAFLGFVLVRVGGLGALELDLLSLPPGQSW